MCRSKRAKLSDGRSIFTKKHQSNDLFESLPQDILYLILSKLPLNEIVRTSTLSTTWRHTWTSCPKLRFNGAMMCGKSTSSEEQYTQIFIDSVNAILKQCGATAVEEFKIKFPFDSMLVGHINNWVKFAVSSRAKNIAIDLEPENFRCCKYRHRFPFELFDKQSMSRLETMCLSLVSLKAQPGFSGFPNLKVLDLRIVDVSSNDLQIVLSSCINLERLSIVLCHLHDDLTVSLPRLMHLHVARCYIDKIHFISKNLRTFVYDGTMETLDLSESTQLRHAETRFPSLTLEYAITELPQAIPHAENLNLSACMQLKVLHLPEGVSKFSHLKHLQLKLDLCSPSQHNLLSLASFLKAAPLLEDLDIHFLQHNFPLQDFQRLPIRSLPPCRHDHLKRVLITGFHGTRGEIELAAHVTDNSTRLEDFVIDPVTRGVDNTMCILRPEEREMFLCMARDNARKYLAGRVVQGARFYVVS